MYALTPPLTPTSCRDKDVKAPQDFLKLVEVICDVYVCHCI